MRANDGYFLFRRCRNEPTELMAKVVENIFGKVHEIWLEIEVAGRTVSKRSKISNHQVDEILDVQVSFLCKSMFYFQANQSRSSPVAVESP
jgi:hypothetical protein